MIYRVILLLAIAASSFYLNAAPVHADDCGGCGGYGYGYGYPYFNQSYRSDRQIPYFAEHPPVYYSVPVPRTYGYSPWAYPGTYRTPEIEIAPEPVMIENPHVTPGSATPEAKSEPEATSTAARKTPQPLVVFNPYFAGSKRVVQAGLER